MDLSRLKTTRSFANLRAGRNDWYRIKAQSDGPTQVMIYDEVGFFGVTAQDFIDEMKQITGPIDLHLNSPGGEVWDGIAIHSFLANRGGVTTYVDSLAASIASVIAMAGTEIVMGRNASFMVHDGWGLVIGNAADMREQAELLDRVSDNIASIYADRTGKPKDDWRKAMLAETWYIGQEAVDAGLADRLAQKPAQTAQPDGDDEGENSLRKSPAAHFDLSVFRNVPERLKRTDGAASANATINLEWRPAANDDHLVDRLRQDIRLRNQAAGSANTAPPAAMEGEPAEPPPTTTDAPTEAPAIADRGFLLPGEAMDPTPKAFRAWIADGLDMLGDTDAAAAVRAAADGGHAPFTGTHTHAHHAYDEQGDDDSHEHEHSHDGDADHHHDHNDGDEESDGDGGMRDAAPAWVLGLESMPLENKALPVHHTDTVDEAWDGPAAVAAMPNDDKVLRYCHAWESPEAAAEMPKEGDDDADDKKANYKWPHHKTEGGPANLAACRNGLARLPGSKIPDSDKAGVEKHLKAHLDDADSGDDSPSNHTHDDLDFVWDPSMTAALKEALQ